MQYVMLPVSAFVKDLMWLAIAAEPYNGE